MQTLNLIGIWKRQQRFSWAFTSNATQRWSIHFIFVCFLCPVLPVWRPVIVQQQHASISLIHFLIGIVTRPRRDMQCGFALIGQFEKFKRMHFLFCWTAHLVKRQMIIKVWDWFDHSIVWNFENDLTHIFIFIVGKFSFVIADKWSCFAKWLNRNAILVFFNATAELIKVIMGLLN